MSGQKAPMSMVRTRILWFIPIVAVSIVAAVFVRYLADHGFVAEEYVLPIYAMILLVSGFLGIRIVNGLIDRIAKPTVGATHAQGIKNVFSIVSGIILVILAFAVFGFNLTGALIGAGFLGIVLGLAGQQVLGNVFAGLSLLVSRPFEIGDRVTLATSTYSLMGSTYSHETEVSGFTGTVQEIGIFFTRIMLDNGLSTVFPNSVVLGSLVMNYSKTDLRRVRVRMYLDTKLDFERFRAGLLESLKKHDEIDGARSSVEIAGIGASGLEIAISVWTRSEVNEPISTMVIREGMKAQQALSAA
jgi:small-conductance mechanosensitive channel